MSMHASRLRLLVALFVLAATSSLLGAGCGTYGGCGSLRPSRMQRFDAAAGSWLGLKRPPTGKNFGVAGGALGELYLASGPKWHRFEPSRNAWRRLADRPSARGAADIADSGGRDVFVLEVNAALETNVAAYDAFTDTWTFGTATPDTHETIAVVGGLVYAMGTRSDTVAAYDPVADTWTPLSPRPAAFLPVTAEAVGGIIYAFDRVGVAQKYDPVADLWVPIQPMPPPLSVRSSGVVGTDVYVGLGWDRVLWGFDVITETWREASTASTGRFDLTVGAAGGVVYLLERGWRPC